MEARGLAHRGLAWLFILLAFVGFVLMLSGVASLQQACSGGMITTLSDLRSLAGQGRRLLQNPISVVGGIPGTVGYLAPVGCNKFFSYAWWITFFNMAMLVLLAAGVTTLIGRFRGGLVALTAVLLVLLMDTANTFLYFNNVQGLTSTVASRARVLVAGAIISAIAYFLIIAIVGWHDEDAALRPQYDAEAAGRKEAKHGGGGGGGGLLGGLLGRKKQGGEAQEEGPGAGTPGSPRLIHVPRPPVVPTSAPGPAGPAQGPPAGPVAYTTAPTVPVSRPAVPVAAGGSP